MSKDNVDVVVGVWRRLNGNEFHQAMSGLWDTVYLVLGRHWLCPYWPLALFMWLCLFSI